MAPARAVELPGRLRTQPQPRLDRTGSHKSCYTSKRLKAHNSDKMSVAFDYEGKWCQNLSRAIKVYCTNGFERKQVYLWAEDHGWGHSRFTEEGKLEFSCWDWMMYGRIGAIHANAKRLNRSVDWYAGKVPCCYCESYALDYPVKPLPQYVLHNQRVGNSYGDDKRIFWIAHRFTRGVEVCPP